MSSRRVFGLALLLALAGCAAPMTRSVSPPPPGAGPVCVPPGMPALADWVFVSADLVPMADAEHRMLAGILGRYVAGGAQIRVWWAHGALAAVDPAPEDPSAPLWIDEGLVGAGLTLLPEGRPLCRWHSRGGIQATTPIPRPPRV